MSHRPDVFQGFCLHCFQLELVNHGGSFGKQLACLCIIMYFNQTQTSGCSPTLRGCALLHRRYCLKIVQAKDDLLLNISQCFRSPSVTVSSTLFASPPQVLIGLSLSGASSPRWKWLRRKTGLTCEFDPLASRVSRCP